MTAVRRRPNRRRQVVLVFGESENDTKLIAELLVALCPELEGKVLPRRKPLVLDKGCDVANLPNRYNDFRSIVEAEQTDADVICVFAHKDCDAVEPAHTELALEIERNFEEIGLHVHAVTPAWETESWLFLWPDAVAAHRPSWRRLNRFVGRDVGRIDDAKEQLRRALRPTGNSSARDYKETDAPEIAKRVRELGIANQPAAKSASYDRFRQCVSDCCSSVRS